MHVNLINQVAVRRDGQGRVALELAKAILDAGHRLTIVARRIDPELEGRCEHVALPAKRLPHLLDDLFVMVPLATLAARRVRADVHITIGACARPPKPAVFNAQFAQLGWRRAWVGPVRPKAYQRVHARLSGAFERSLVRRAEVVIASTPVVARDIAEGIDTPTVVVPNGIDLSEHPVLTTEERRAARDEIGIPNDAFAIAFVGEYATPRKGLEWLLQAVAGGDEHVIVAGAGRDRAVVERVRELGVEDRVHLVGFAPPRLAFAASDAAAVPSVYEPFSLVALEAAASGVPVLASDAVGAVPLLGDGVITVADPTDHSQIRGAIDELRRDPTIASSMAKAGRAAVEQLAWDVVMRDAVGALERVVAAGPR